MYNQVVWRLVLQLIPQVKMDENVFTKALCHYIPRLFVDFKFYLDTLKK